MICRFMQFSHNLSMAGGLRLAAKYNTESFWGGYRQDELLDEPFAMDFLAVHGLMNVTISAELHIKQDDALSGLMGSFGDDGGRRG